jgi:Fur family ferric uptake transcriptional regulator
MNITRAQSSDAALLAALHAQCFAEHWSASAFAEMTDSPNVVGLLMRTNSEASSGFIILRLAADECEILSLGIVPEERRQGLGHQLLKAGAQEAFRRGARAMFLEVAASNIAALALYQRAGFQQVGRRNNYYRNCESLADALVLRCELPIRAWESESKSSSLGAERNDLPMTRIENLCAEKGLRMTDQRRVIARVLSQSTDHPDAEELYRRASAIDPHISIATVYRTVRLFEDAGILERHDFRNGRSRYEEVHESHHDHLIDIQSGNVIEFRNEEIERLQKRVAEELGFELVDHRLELYGVPRKTEKPGDQ